MRERSGLGPQNLILYLSWRICSTSLHFKFIFYLILFDSLDFCLSLRLVLFLNLHKLNVNTFKFSISFSFSLFLNWKMRKNIGNWNTFTLLISNKMIKVSKSQPERSLLAALIQRYRWLWYINIFQAGCLVWWLR